MEHTTQKISKTRMVKMWNDARRQNMWNFRYIE